MVGMEKSSVFSISNPYAPWCWNMYQHLAGTALLINIPAQWGKWERWDVYATGGFSGPIVESSLGWGVERGLVTFM